jgi:hypothetical protein
MSREICAEFSIHSFVRAASINKPRAETPATQKRLQIGDASASESSPSFYDFRDDKVVRLSGRIAQRFLCGKPFLAASCGKTLKMGSACAALQT